MIENMFKKFFYSEEYKENLKYVGKEQFLDDCGGTFGVDVYKDVSLHGRLQRGIGILLVASIVIPFGIIIVDGIKTKIESRK
jgi:hypothetical protein